MRSPSLSEDKRPCLVSSARVQLGGAEVFDPEVGIPEAVQLAKEADIAVVIVGLNGDWESAGQDRDTLALPGLTDRLVAEVVRANPRTVVVCQSVCLRRFFIRLTTGTEFQSRDRQ